MKKSKPPLNARVNHMIERSNARRKIEAQRKAEYAEHLKRKAQAQLDRARGIAKIEVIAREEAKAKVVARGMDAMAENRASYDVDSDGNCTPVPIEDDDAKVATRPVPHVATGMRMPSGRSPGLVAFVLIAISLAFTGGRDDFR